MKKIKYTIIYLHGFASSGNSRKGQILKNYFKNNTVLTPTLSPEPQKAIAEITKILNQDCFKNNLQEHLLIGSSLGGFYADYFSAIYDIPAILINPLVDPLDAKQFIGKNQQLSTGESFEFTQKDMDYLLFLKEKKDSVHLHTKKSPIYILLAQDDEVLDFSKAKSEYQNKLHIIYTAPTGGHRFVNEKMLIDVIEMMGNSENLPDIIYKTRIEGMELLPNLSANYNTEDFFDVHLMRLLTENLGDNPDED